MIRLRRALTHLVLVLSASWLAIGCGRREAPPNVILIVMDAARADHLGCYGYDRPTSPNIDAFAATATLYERAIASAPWSIPSHASIFTGMDPFQHGAHRIKASSHPLISGRKQEIVIKNRAKTRGTPVIKSPLGLKRTTLAQLFQSEGYETAAIIANDGYLAPKWGLSRGFDKYNADLAHADVVNERVLTWLDGTGEKPFFLFINYMDAHKPYNTTPRPGVTSEPVVQDNDVATALLRTVQDQVDRLPPKLVAQAIDQYDTGIANLDAGLGALFDELAARGLLDRSIVVLTSDHGEAFGEHHFVLHGNDVYEEEVWVPLIVRAPGQKTGERVSLPVSGSDIPRLILSHIPGDITAKHRMHFPNAPGNHPVISQNYYSLKQMSVSPQEYDRIRTAIYDWPYKYIDSSDGDSELYNLETDPREKNNLIAREPDLAEALAGALEEYQLKRKEAQELLEQPELTDKEIEKLKALGYVGN